MLGGLWTDGTIVSVDSSKAKIKLKEKDVKHTKIDDLKKLFQIYELRDQIGQGTFGMVVEAIEKATSKQFAIKIVSKYYEGTPCLQEAYREIQILKFVHHPNIISLERVFETAKKIYMVIELCRETLYSKFKSSSPFTEKITKQLTSQIVSAVQYLHKNDIVHRDIKMENVLLTTNPENENDDNFVKLSDFGSSIISRGGAIRDVKMMKDRVGTIIYMAPEILLEHSYSELCDVWSVGIILYTLTFGRHPFASATSERDLLTKICQMEPDYPTCTADNDCIELLRSMLKKDPAERITAIEMSKHQWFGSRVHRRKDQTVIDYMKQWKSEMMTVSLSDNFIHDDILTISEFD